MILSPGMDNYNGSEGETLSIPFQVSTAESQNTLRFNYDVSPLPRGAELQVDPNSTQRRFVWWPDFDQAGQYKVNFAVTDALGNRSQRSVNITVADRTNGKPAIKVSDTVAWEKFQVQPNPNSIIISPIRAANLRIDAFDPDNTSANNVKLRVEGLPTSGVQLGYWPTKTGANLRIGWLPTMADVGIHQATIVAEDLAGNKTFVPLEINVHPWSSSNTLLNFFPHLFSGVTEEFYNRDAAIKHAVVKGEISIGVVASTDGGQAWTEGDDPNDIPPNNARFRLVLLDSNGNETALSAGPMSRDQKVKLDTTKLAEGQYVIAVELLDGDLDLWHPWTMILTVDNDGVPVRGPQKLASVGTRGTYGNWNLPGGKYGVDWVTVDGPSQKSTEPYPFKLVAPPASAAERSALIDAKNWVAEPLTKNYSYREEVDRFLVVSPSGHPYIGGKMVKGEKLMEPGSAFSLDTAKKYIGFDGPRNNNSVSDTSHYTPDPNGTGFIGVEASGRVFRVDRDGKVTTIFGPRRKSDVIPYQVDDLKVSAAALQSQQEEFLGNYDVMLNNPWDLTFDPLNSKILYIADLNNHRIAKLDFSGATPTLSTFAGKVGQAGYTNGLASQATFNGPISLAADPDTGVLYVSDRYNQAIRKIDRNGNVSTLVGKGPQSVPDRIALNLLVQQAGTKEAFLPKSVAVPDAVIYYPFAVRVDSRGDVLFSEGVVSSIRKVNLQQGTVEKIRIVAEWGIAENWFDVDWRGNVGPIDDIIVAERNVGGRFARMSSDGTRYDSLNDILFVLLGDPPGSYNSGYGATGAHALTWSTVIDDSSSAIGVVSNHRLSFTLLRPLQAGDVSTRDINNAAFTHGLVVAAAGTAQSLPFEAIATSTVSTNSGAIATSLRPSLFNLYGGNGHSFVGNLGTYDDLAKMSDVELANFIRAGAGGAIPRPEITGIDLRNLIYYIRTWSLQGKSQAPSLTTITQNLQAAALYDPTDSTKVEIRDIQATPLSNTVVRITWATDEDAIGIVQYGTTDRLGQFSAVEPGYSKVHEVTLRSLLPNRQYHLRVRQKDRAGNMTLSGDVAFSLGNPDLTPPTTPGDLRVVGLTATTISLAWNPSTDAVEFAGYALDVSLENSFASYVPGYQSKPLGAATNFVVTGMRPETTYYLRIRALDASGNFSGYSNVVKAVSPPAPPNTAPTVDAGKDQTLTILDTATLTATAVDDGLPIGSNLTYNWTTVSGPGTVAFESPTSMGTSATFSAVGSYVIKATVSDGQLSGFDTLTVTVNNAPGGGLLARWKFDGDVLDSARNNHGTSKNATFEDGKYGKAIVFDGVSNNLKINDPRFALTPTQITIAGWLKPGAIENTFVIGGGSYELRTTVFKQYLFLLRNSNNVSSPAIYFGSIQTGAWTHLAITWDGTTIKTYQDGVLKSQTAFAGTAVYKSNLTLALGSAVYGNLMYRGGVDDLRIYATALDGSRILSLARNTAPSVDAGANKNVQLGATVVLNGVATDDGLPLEPGAITFAWQKLSGPGDVRFGDRAKGTTTASFSALGNYVLELAASDGDFVSRATVTITVEPAETDLPMPTAHWRFDGDVEDSVGDNHGSANNLAFVPGISNAGISLSGSTDYVIVNDSNGELTRSQLTIAGWFKPTALRNAFIVTNGSYELRATAANEFLFDLYNNSGAFSGYLYFGQYQLNVWTHLAVTWDGQTVKAYQDGVLKAQLDFEGTKVKATNFPLNIGASIWGANRFRGSIDELQIYSVALNETQIAKLLSPIRAAFASATATAAGSPQASSGQLSDSLSNPLSASSLTYSSVSSAADPAPAIIKARNVDAVFGQLGSGQTLSPSLVQMIGNLRKARRLGSRIGESVVVKVLPPRI